MNNLDWIAKWADYTPQKVAITSYSSNKKYNYEQLHCYSNTLCNNLAALTLNEGDRIAVLAEFGPEYIVLFSACQRLGLILVPLNFRLATPELTQLVEDCQPSLIIYSESNNEKLQKIQRKNSCNTLPLSQLRTYFEIGKENTITSPLDTYQINEETPIFIFYTSGTTATPKGVVYTNKMLFWNSLNTSMQLGITYRDSTLNTLPPYHTSSWNIFITPLLHKGAHIGLLDKFDIEQVLCLLELNQTTLFMALPTMLSMMQKSEVFEKVQLQKLRYIISGGEMVNPELVAHWKELKNVAIRPGYGLTEAGPSITSLHHDMSLLKPGSIGKPNFYLDIKIINREGRLVSYNEVGELCIRGPIVTPGYWNNSVETKNKIKEGWLHTGDLAYQDEEGYLYLKGRKDDMYISGGENIYPQEIELHLKNLSEVKNAVVLSTVDKKWGACGIAFVTVNNVHITSEQIREKLKDGLASYKHPKFIFVLKDIPLTSLSKISRKKLLHYFTTLKNEI